MTVHIDHVRFRLTTAAATDANRRICLKRLENPEPTEALKSASTLVSQRSSS
jgi:hypothetical protein